MIKSLMTMVLFSILTQAYGEPLLVLDSQNTAATLPKKFHTTAAPFTNPKTAINSVGLNTLQLIGSAQFSEAELDQVLKQHPMKSVIVIDLRQESHGFINHTAVSWYEQQNSANQDKTPTEIQRLEQQLLSQINHLDSIIVHHILQKTALDAIIATQEQTFLQPQALSEEALVTAKHLGYARLYVQDHHMPSQNELMQFINIVKTRPKDTWLYLHCRGGKGRTTTFMILVDIMHNADKVSFNDILKRQVLMGGSDLNQLPPPDSYKYPLALERLQFLQQFYWQSRSQF